MESTGPIQQPPADGSKPYLNTWDVPELMDGARAGASNVEQVAFYERSKELWRSDQKHEKELNFKARKDAQRSAEEQIEVLREMFPLLDAGLIRSLYYERVGTGYVEDLSALIESLMALTPDNDEEPPGPVVNLDPLIDIDNLADFPELTRSAPEKTSTGTSSTPLDGWTKL